MGETATRQHDRQSRAAGRRGVNRIDAIRSPVPRWSAAKRLGGVRGGIGRVRVPRSGTERWSGSGRSDSRFGAWRPRGSPLCGSRSELRRRSPRHSARAPVNRVHSWSGVGLAPGIVRSSRHPILPRGCDIERRDHQRVSIGRTILFHIAEPSGRDAPRTSVPPRTASALAQQPSDVVTPPR